MAVSYFRGASLLIMLVLVGYSYLSNTRANHLQTLRLTPLFSQQSANSVQFASSIITSPLSLRIADKHAVLIASSNGELAAIDANTGALLWQVTLPLFNAQEAQLIATPVIVDNKIIVSYQCLINGVRVSHHLVVIDAQTHTLDSRFPALTFAAQQQAVDGRWVHFNPATAFSHAALKHFNGLVYAAFGNSGDVQPFHGWLFAVDMKAWQSNGVGSAIVQVLLTTPEPDCPVSMAHGTQEMICGGGIWSPAGIAIYPSEAGAEVFVPTGNGQLDLARRDYANTLLRVDANLHFEAACNAALCADFDASKPQAACMSSCKNVFIPRLNADDAPFRPANGECDNKSFADCLAWMDYDLGGSTPAKLTLSNGQSVLVQAGKDGGAYLIDAQHLGRQYDRQQIVPLCGAESDPCALGWAGMIVTQVLATQVDNAPVAIITTFSADKTHAAGLVALKIILKGGEPRFEKLWQFPAMNSALALQSFRSHPSLPALSKVRGESVVWVIDIGKRGTLYGVRVRDGQLLVKQSLQGTGRQLAAPLIDEQKIYVPSMLPDSHKAIVEAYRIETAD